jgi:hypothetical protein
MSSEVRETHYNSPGEKGDKRDWENAKGQQDYYQWRKDDARQDYKNTSNAGGEAKDYTGEEWNNYVPPVYLDNSKKGLLDQLERVEAVAKQMVRATI